MTTTTSAYNLVTQNLSRYQKMTAADPMVASASAYYSANIGKVKSVADFVKNYRLLSYALSAYGLDGHQNDKALIRKILEGGVSSSKSLAHTLNDSRWLAFAKAYDFVGRGAEAIAATTAVATTKANYTENQLEADQGAQNVGVQLALYFNRVAPNVTSAYGVLADKNLLQVVQTIFKLPPSTAATDIDRQASIIGKLAPIADFKDPKKLEQLTARFTAMYDLTYGPSSGATTSLTVAGSASSSSSSAAFSILSGVISANGAALASSSTIAVFSNGLLTSLQGLRLGG